MGEHSPIGPSSYYRFKECPGSVNLSRGLPRIQSEEARIGNMAHECAKIWIKNRLCPKDRFPELTQEDLDAVEKYVDFVDNLLGSRNDPDLRYWIEHRFDMSKIYPELYGTVDFACYSKRHEKLVVVDYKHGAGYAVEVKENSQLQYYGLGAINELNLPVKSVEFVIVQPRCYHKEGPIRKWQTQASTLFDFMGNLISDAEKTKQPGALLKIGSWCRFCPAAPVTCPAIKERSISLVSQSFLGSAYDPMKLSECLKILPLMEGWIKSVREFALYEAQTGKIPPGFKIVSKKAIRKWREGWTGERLAQEFGLKAPEMFDLKLKSPAQVERIVDKSVRPHIEDLVDKVSSGYKLVEDNDPAPAISEQEIDSFTVLEV